MVHDGLAWLAGRLAADCELQPHEIQAVLSLPAELGAFEAHRDFVQRGVTEVAFLIVEGIVARYSDLRNGKRQITGMYLPGDVAKLGATVLPSLATLQGLTHGTALRIPLAALRELIDDHPRLAQCFWKESVRQAAIGAEWMLSLGRRTATQRLAHLLCETGWRLNGDRLRDGGEFYFPVTQTQLAEMLGLTSVHVNRTVRELRERGLVAMTGKRVTIHDWRGLEELGDFDPGYLGGSNSLPWGATTQCEQAEHRAT